jgi:uncharacterized protein
MTCQTCGAPVPAEATTCPTCGAAAVPQTGAAAGGGYAGPPGGGGAPPGPYPGPAPGYPAPSSHPSGLTSEVRNWAVAAHLSAFLGSFVALAVLGPLVVWLIRRESDGFTERHAREALNFNLTLLVLIVAGGVLALITLGIGLIVVIPAAVFFGIAWIVCTIIGAVRASEGREYRYPFTIRFVS